MNGVVAHNNRNSYIEARQEHLDPSYKGCVLCPTCNGNVDFRSIFPDPMVTVADAKNLLQRMSYKTIIVAATIPTFIIGFAITKYVENGMLPQLIDSLNEEGMTRSIGKLAEISSIGLQFLGVNFGLPLIVIGWGSTRDFSRGVILDVSEAVAAYVLAGGLLTAVANALLTDLEP